MAPVRPVVRISIIAATVSTVLLFLHVFIASNPVSSTSLYGPGNTTLGFGAVIVHSAGNESCWRLKGLRMAADYCGLQLTVPQLEPPDETQIQQILNATTEMNVHQITAALQQKALLEYFLQQDYTTVLIVEDDADFDINIRELMKLFSTSLFNAIQPSSPYDDNLSPYQHNDWDILWLGHLGLEYGAGTTTYGYHDPYALDMSHTTSYFNNLYEQLRGKSNTRTIVRDAAPLATYAYALHKESAKLLLEQNRVISVPYDIPMHLACKGVHGKFRCIAPVPEIFHHHRAAGGQRLGDMQNAQQDDFNWYMSVHRYTYNIKWSARCNSAKVGEKIGDLWQCLPGKYDGFEST